MPFEVACEEWNMALACATEEQKKKYRLLDNKVGEIADWDYNLLVGELEGMDFDGFDFGFDDLLAEMADDSGEEANGDSGQLSDAVEDDYEPVLPETPKSKLGEVYQLGDHRLM